MLTIKDIINTLNLEGAYLSKDTIIASGDIDSRNIKKDYLYFALKGSRTDGHNYIKQALENGATAAVVNLDYVNTNKYPIIRTKSVEIMLGKIASLYRQKMKAKIIAITGTNGKTTTKDMLYYILKQKYNTICTEKNYNNELGVPLSLFKITEKTEYAIIELGANHFGEIEYLSKLANPFIGIITNVGKGHIEFFGDIKGVLKAKLELYNHIKENGGYFFCNDADKFIYNSIEKTENVISFGTEDSDFFVTDIYTNDDGYGCFKFEDLEITLGGLGELNIRNAIAAIAIASFLKITPTEIKDSLTGFSDHSKRGEIVEKNSSKVILDCYNANPTSMRFSISQYASSLSSLFFILGDMLELGINSEKEHRDLGLFLKDIEYDRIFLFGEKMRNCFMELKNDKRVSFFNNFDLMKKQFEQEMKNYKYIVLKASRGISLEKLLD